MSTLKVRIHNTDGSTGITSAKQAKRYVRRGRAVWMPDGSVRFLAASTQHQAVVRHAACVAYDRNVATDGCTRDELRHIPFVGRIDSLMGRGKQRRTGAKQVAG